MLAGPLTPAFLRPVRSVFCCNHQRQLLTKHTLRLQTSQCLIKYPRISQQPCCSAPNILARCSSSARLDMGSTSDVEDIAIVLVDHGSKRAEANAMLEDFADLYRSVACNLPSCDRSEDVLATTNLAEACFESRNLQGECFSQMRGILQRAQWQTKGGDSSYGASRAQHRCGGGQVRSRGLQKGGRGALLPVQRPPHH